MADTHHKPRPAISKTQRNPTVGYISTRYENRATNEATYYSRSPTPHLKGHRLGEVGFQACSSVRVTIEPGRIVIYPR
jgi:toxic protein SymE